MKPRPIIKTAASRKPPVDPLYFVDFDGCPDVIHVFTRIRGEPFFRISEEIPLVLNRSSEIEQVRLRLVSEVLQDKCPIDTMRPHVVSELSHRTQHNENNP